MINHRGDEGTKGERKEEKDGKYAESCHDFPD